jgi:hypothetical protein
MRMSWATCAHGETSLARGNQIIQTRSGCLSRSCSTGSAPNLGVATTRHRTPDQNQSRQRAVLHTSLCTVLACLDIGRDYSARSPLFLPSRLPRSGMAFSPQHPGSSSFLVRATRTSYVHTGTGLTLLNSAAHVRCQACWALAGLIAPIPDGQIFPLRSPRAREPLQAIIAFLPADRYSTLLLQGAVDLGVFDRIRGVIRIQDVRNELRPVP